ncbi:DUF6339 family protein [Patulibacter americanus]|uniref:DUF6339 family protein n=1 Tax=Patulibacter americanus TaxID=588672 RepID=UPI0003B50A38|nr:DUF6339 family protein [Patulibacter americanus]
MKVLAPAVGARLTDAFVIGSEEPDVEGLVSDVGRVDVATDDVVDLFEHARKMFGDDAAASDRWLGPRVHAALRLTRREAGERGMWLHLSIVDCPDYVRWRYPDQRARFIGGAATNAFSRLWWTTELFRRGSDYGPASEALKLQEIPNTLLKISATRNHAFCAALLDFLHSRRTDGKRLVGRQINRLSTAANAQLFVAALDAVAPAAVADSDARRSWISSPPILDDLLADGVAGPDDLADPLFDDKVAAALQLLHRVADSAGIATEDDPTAGSRRPGDVGDD